MTTQVADRQQWAVEQLLLAPVDEVLEIGCGHGTAVALVCEKLAAGHVTAVDRSETMIAAASKKNRSCIEAGKARLMMVALDEADFGTTRFDKVFAVNVNVFWLRPERELAVIRTALAPGGSLYLFYQPPDSKKADEIIPKLRGNLEKHSFTLRDILRDTLPSGPVLGVTAVATDPAP